MFGRLLFAAFWLVLAGTAFNLTFDSDPRVGLASRLPMFACGAVFGALSGFSVAYRSLRGLRATRTMVALGLLGAGLGVFALGMAPIDGASDDQRNAAFLAVGGAMFAGGLIAAAGVRETPSTRLRAIAERVGASMRGWTLLEGPTATRDGGPIWLRVWDSDDVWGFEIDGAWDADFVIDRESLTAMRQILEGETLKTGDAAFDRTVFLRGPSAALRARLDAPGRALVAHAIALGAGVRGKRVSRHTEADGDPAECVAAALALANLLTQPVHETSALREIATQDPLPGVRKMALLAFAEVDRAAGMRACEAAFEDSSADVRRAAAEWVLAHEPGAAQREYAERTLLAITAAGGELSLDEASTRGALSDAAPSKAGAVTLAKKS